MTSNVAITKSSVISISLAPNANNGDNLAACFNSSNYPKFVILQKSASMPIQIVANTTVEVDGDSVDLHVLKTDACGQFKSRIDFVLPETLYPNEKLNFTIGMVNGRSAGNEVFVNLSVHGCRASLFMLGWSDGVVAGAPAREFRASCLWNLVDCGPCNNAPRHMWATASQTDGKPATILSSRVAPAVLVASVRDEGPVDLLQFQSFSWFCY
jgi:hypothetical protein